MKIVLKNNQEHEHFEALLDVIVQAWQIDDAEALFISDFQTALKKAYIDLQGRENTQGLIKKDLLHD